MLMSQHFFYGFKTYTLLPALQGLQRAALKLRTLTTLLISELALHRVAMSIFHHRICGRS